MDFVSWAWVSDTVRDIDVQACIPLSAAHKTTFEVWREPTQVGGILDTTFGPGQTYEPMLIQPISTVARCFWQSCSHSPLTVIVGHEAAGSRVETGIAGYTALKKQATRHASGVFVVAVYIFWEI